MSRTLKILAGIGIFFLVVIGFFIYLWWADLKVTDYFKGPDEVIDETIAAAQEEDHEGFKRLLTKDSVVMMEDLHVWSTGWLESGQGDLFQPGSLVTWDSVMAEMAGQGGFKLAKDISFEEKWTENQLTVTIVFDDDKKKAYRMVKKGGIWRIDLTKDPVIARANTCMGNERICRPDSRKMHPGQDPMEYLME